MFNSVTVAGNNMIADNLHIVNDTLFFAGHSTKDLAEKYGSPIYVMDEGKIRENCRKYVNGMKKYFGENAKPFYASKACSFKKIYNILGIFTPPTLHFGIIYPYTIIG